MAYDPLQGGTLDTSIQSAPSVGYDPLQGPRKVTGTSYIKLPSNENGVGAVVEDLGHKFGVGVRDVVQGRIGGLADLVTAPFRGAINYVAPGSAAPPSELIDKAGGLLPPWLYSKPQTEREKALSPWVQGGASMIPVGPPGTSLVNKTLVAPTGTTSLPRAGVAVGTGAVAGGAGEAAAEAIPEDSPWAVLKPLARLAGGVGAAGLTNAALHGGERLANATWGRLNDAAKAYERLRMTPPTVGTATGSPGTQNVEMALSQVPGSQGRMRVRMQDTLDKFGQNVDDASASLHYDATGRGGIVPNDAQAGQIAQDRLRNWRWNDQDPNSFPAQQAVKFAPVDARMAHATVDVSGYRNALRDGSIDRALAGLPETQQAFARAELKKLLDAIEADRPGANPTVRWEQAQAIRRQIGDMMGTPAFQQSLGEKAMTRLYAGIAGDMQQAANNNGVGRIFREANQHSTEGFNFISRVADKAVKTNNPSQDIAPGKAADDLLKLYGTDLAELRARVPEAADALAAYKLRDMANAKPGQALQAGDTSSNTFLTNLIKLRNDDPNAFQALFGHNPRIRQMIDDLGTVAGTLRTSSQMANVSRTSPAAYILSTLLGGAGGAGAQLLTGSPTAALGATATGIGIPFAGGHVLTNPALIRALSGQPGPRNVRPLVPGVLGTLPGITEDERRR